MTHAVPFFEAPDTGQTGGPEIRDYLILELASDGQIQIIGDRESVNWLLEYCEKAGLWLELESLTWCG